MKIYLAVLLLSVPLAAAADETAPVVEPATVAQPSPEVKAPAQEAADAVAPKEEPQAEAPKEEPKPEEPKAEAPKEDAAKAEEPKPEPKPKAPEPKVTVTAPKLEETKPLPAAKPAGEKEEWAFVKGAAADSDSAVQDAAAVELKLFVRRHPDSAHAPEALALFAGLRAKKDWEAAAAADLQLVYEYHGSASELQAKSSYLELVGKKASRKQRAALTDLVNVPDLADKADRLSALWTRVAETAPDALYEPVTAEVRDFLVRFPDHKDNDRLQAALARLHAANDKPAAAVLSWRKLLALYPASAQRAQAQMTIGDLYADALRDPKKAIDAYQQLIADDPQAPEVLAALEDSARLFEDKLKQYDLAVEMDEKIVKLFPKTAGSLKALKAEARLQRDRLSKPDDAVKTLVALSAMHGGQDGVDALLLAADIAHRDMKDYPREAALRAQVAADYPAAKEAPRALYEAASVYEDDAKDGGKALQTYHEVANKFPSDKYGKKAAARAEKLANAR